MHVMIDLETLSTRTDAAIVQIGAVLFEPVSRGKIRNDKPFMRHVLVQDGAGSIDNSTLAWWLQQPNAKALGRALETTAVPLAQALEDLVAWPKQAVDLEWDAITGVWAKPADFDLAILKTAFARFGALPPWDRRVTRCAKTLFEVSGGAPEIDWTGLDHHDAFDDALGQAMQVQKVAARR